MTLRHGRRTFGVIMFYVYVEVFGRKHLHELKANTIEFAHKETHKFIVQEYAHITSDSKVTIFEITNSEPFDIATAIETIQEEQDNMAKTQRRRQYEALKAEFET